MMHPKPVRLAGAVVAAALFILAAGGAAIASNMGFKLNRPIALAGAGQIGNNWASIPYFNPYTTLGQFCIQTNLPRVFGNSAIVTTLDSDLGSFNGLACNAIGSGGPAPIPGRGLQIRVPNIAGNPTSIIIVGSHNPTLSIQIPDASRAGQTGHKSDFWWAVPYHTTAVTAADICTQLGMKPTLPKGVVERLDAPTGSFTAYFCGNPGTGFNLVLGEHVRLRNPAPTAPFVPAHF